MTDIAVDSVDAAALAGPTRRGRAGGRASRGRVAVVSGDVPLVVCVSADRGVRERVIRQLEDCGAVLMCADLAELRAMLFPSAELGFGAGSIFTAGTVAAADSLAPPPGVVNLGDLVIDTAGHLVTWRGQPLPLTRLERELLGRLASPPVAVWTYQRLFDAVWGKAYLGDTSILHSAVKRLRGKLRAAGGGLGVETVRGVGYRLALS
jgi:two-component system, OmpR family, response regulator MtrA